MKNCGHFLAISFIWYKFFQNSSKCSPSDSMQRCWRFIQSLKAPWTSKTGICFSVIVAAILTAFSASCKVPLEIILILRNLLLFPGAWSELHGDSGSIFTSTLVSNSETMIPVWLRAFSSCNIQLLQISLGTRQILLSNRLSVSEQNSLLTVCPCTTSHCEPHIFGQRTQ